MNPNSESQLPGVEIPLDALTEEALSGVIDHFILREGTDYGVSEVSIEKKREQIRTQLSRGHIHIVFDPNTESVTLLTDQDWRRLRAGN